MDYREIILLDDRFEGDVVMEVLRQEGIPFRVRQFGNDGIDQAFSLQRGWGIISVEEHNCARAIELVEEALKVSTAQPWDDMKDMMFGGGGTASRIDQ